MITLAGVCSVRSLLMVNFRELFEYSLMNGRGSQQGTLKVSVNDAKAEHIYEYSASGRLLSRTRVPHGDMNMKRISSTVSIADHTTGILAPGREPAYSPCLASV